MTQEQLDKYYEHKRLFSYSAISLLLYSPKKYAKKYIENINDDIDTVAKSEGKLVHLLCLIPDQFDKYYIVNDLSLPNDNQKLIIDRIYNTFSGEKELVEYEDYILSILREMNLYQSLKEDSKRLSTVINPITVSYYNFLRNAKGKTIISKETYDKCKEIANKMLSIPVVREALSIDSTFDENIDVFNEIELSNDKTPYNFGFKGIIDNYSVGRKNKVITINDIKKTSKTLSSFNETIEYYKYWIQAVIYTMLVSLKENKPDYTVVFNFIVYDINDDVCIFRVSQPKLNSWVDRFVNEVLPAINYHYNNKDFNLPYKFNKGVVEL